MSTVSVAVSVQSAFRVGFNGMHAAVKLHRTLLFIVTSRTTAMRTLQCFTLNGGIFLGSIAFLELGLLPALSFVGDSLRSTSWAAGHLAEESQKQQEGDPATVVSGGDAAPWVDIVSAVQELTSNFFTVLWLVPMYALSFILNTLWYVEIAEQVFKQEYGRMTPITSIAEIIRDEVYRILLMVWLTLQIYGVYALVPYVGSLYAFVYTSWICAFYCYDYKWTLQGWTIDQRLHVFEEHWVFMLGFGAPCALVTWWLPQFVGYGIYAMVFPLSMILAIISSPVKHLPCAALPARLPVFYWAQRCNLAVLRRCGPKRSRTKNNPQTRTGRGQESKQQQ
jgi:etoposide-induced 2.4 mRNA